MIICAYKSAAYTTSKADWTTFVPRVHVTEKS